MDCVIKRSLAASQEIHSDPAPIQHNVDGRQYQKADTAHNVQNFKSVPTCQDAQNNGKRLTEKQNAQERVYSS